jgi:energy coupling factor transporter S component ThiW
MNELNSKKKNEETQEKAAFQNVLTKRVATAGIFIAVGLVLSFLNPFAYFTLFGTKINPFAHFINAITGVLIGLTFSCIVALGIAILRFAFGIGTIHAFHGGISGAVVVGSSAYILRKKNPKRIEFAALTEPIGTVFIGGTIAQIIAPIGSIEGFFIYWGLFAASSIPGCILGFIMLKILRRAGISWEDYF